MNIALIGKGGHSKVVEDIILSNKDYVIVAYLDDQYEEFHHNNGRYFGPIDEIDKLRSIFFDLVFVITIGNNSIRKQIAQRLCLSKHEYATLIHEKAVVSPNAKLGQGTVVMASAVINADAKIGDHVIINSGAVVEHDNVIGDFVHISPGVVLTGIVLIGEGSHIGAGSVIIPSVHVGEWSILGAGATAISDIPDNCTAVGVPAKIVQKNSSEVSKI
ncbi:MAG TPA: acetyltransferase [Bacillales bacterium]|nr:acetyltransferase [Bacillales bacterium]